MELSLQDVNLAQDGDRLAFTRLVAGHQNYVTAIALGIVRDLSASEEIAQEVFLGAWQQLGRLRNRSSFRPWIAQLTRHRAFDHLRARRREQIEPLSDETLQSIADPQAPIDDTIVNREGQVVLQQALESLPEDARELLLLFYREGRSVEALASLLQIQAATVKKRLERARAHLRSEVLERFGEVAQRTAPGLAFTVAVTAAVNLTVPATAAAAGWTASSFVKATGAKTALAISAAVGATTAIFLVAGSALSFVLGSLMTIVEIPSFTRWWKRNRKVAAILFGANAAAMFLLNYAYDSIWVTVGGVVEFLVFQALLYGFFPRPGDKPFRWGPGSAFIVAINVLCVYSSFSRIRFAPIPGTLTAVCLSVMIWDFRRMRAQWKAATNITEKRQED